MRPAHGFTPLRHAITFLPIPPSKVWYVASLDIFDVFRSNVEHIATVYDESNFNELKMRNQFARDLSAKKRELLALLTTSRSLAPRVLKKPAVPVTPLKRVSKSLRIRNRPGTAPAPAASTGTGGGMIANKAVDVGRGTKIAWDEKETDPQVSDTYLTPI